MEIGESLHPEVVGIALLGPFCKMSGGINFFLFIDLRRFNHIIPSDERLAEKAS